MWQRMKIVVDGELLYDSEWRGSIETVFDIDRDVQPGARYVDYKAPDILVAEKMSVEVTTSGSHRPAVN